ncbi:hypothetical protein Pla110_44300 [Polystyrenella longa]|uniref:Uncharacterized protein n=1 Tax=Polystyrenella longa TaxID=2528007 RepID=A0A518CTW7_9PLAN|nr:hypothetical protein [Polystyrenella longa]QDU82669.1 hypothetical protein Pla110_44300 [Polystyrenella longa]
MSTLTSASTYAEVIAAYKDNASYAEDNSVTKARAFITACRFLLLMMPGRSAKGRQQEIEFTQNLQAIKAEQKQASNWMQARASANSQYHYADLSDFRN